jgi:hypothetical protein
MRALGLFVLLFCLSFSLAAQTRDSSDTALPLRAERSPAVAVGLSLLLPGSGQLYNHQPTKAAIHFGLVAGAFAWVNAREIGHTNADIKPIDWISIACLSLAYLGAAVDAGLNASGPEGPGQGHVQVSGTSPHPLLSFGLGSLQGKPVAHIELHF